MRGHLRAGFLQARGLPTTGVTLRQHVDLDEATHPPARISLEIGLPEDFQEKYRAPLLRAAEGCKVKKTIAAQPTTEVSTTTATPRAEAIAPR